MVRVMVVDSPSFSSDPSWVNRLMMLGLMVIGELGVGCRGMVTYLMDRPEWLVRTKDQV